MSTPTIILVAPQMGENIGAAARAMANFDLTDLRIVAPRDGWPNDKADAMAAGGIDIIKNAKVFDTLEEAISDLQFLMATTARKRDMNKGCKTPREAMDTLPNDLNFGIMFGRENNGLSNEELTLADTLLTIPVSETYPSINIAQAVNIVCYEYHNSSLRTERSNTEKENVDRHVANAPRDDEIVNKKDLIALFDHLETELDKTHFFKTPEKREKMVQNIRTMLTRAELTDQETRTFRGIITALTKQ